MALDIRAKVICKIGDETPLVVSGGWSDDHAQGTGLIRTRGELIVRGLIKPALGQQIKLAFIQNGIASQFPRSLRVLGAFADPFRNQTTMQVGCLLTLRENLKGTTPADQQAYTWNDPANSNIVCGDFLKYPVSITAAYVASVCATQLGLSVPGGFPLTNVYTKDAIDLSSGYASVLSDLLVSESYVGYLNAAEELNIVSLADLTGIATVIEPDDIIDVSSISSGDIPTEAVSVSYSYNKFKPQETEPTEAETKKVAWETETVTSPPTTITIEHTNGTYTKQVTVVTQSTAYYDSFDRMTKRVDEKTTHVAELNQAYIKWFAGETSETYYDGPLTEITTTINNYATPAENLSEAPTPLPGSCAVIYSKAKVYNPEVDNVVISTVVETQTSEMALAGALNIPEYSGQTTTPLGGTSNWSYQPSTETNIVSSITTTTYEKDPDTGITKALVNKQVAKAFSQQGQQVGASEAQDAIDDTGIAGVVNRGKVLVNEGDEITIRSDREFGVQRRPSSSQLKNTANIKETVESVSDVTFVTGDEASATVTQYSVPYSPDDAVTPAGAGGTDVSQSNAAVKAKLYGITQNKLAYGHRNGFSLQLPAPTMPAYPLDRLSISASDVSALYVCNGTSWSFDSNGIVCNTDALFIGGIGITGLGGSLWFPVAPGITLLGPAPEVYENEYYEPANSVEVGEEFDAVNPPAEFWDEDLPSNTPAIPKKETEITQTVPPWKLDIKQAFPVKSKAIVVRVYGPPAVIQPVTFVTKTKATAVAIPQRIVSLPTYTKAAVEPTVQAIRSDKITMFAAFCFATY